MKPQQSVAAPTTRELSERIYENLTGHSGDIG